MWPELNVVQQSRIPALWSCVAAGCREAWAKQLACRRLCHATDLLEACVVQHDVGRPGLLQLQGAGKHERGHRSVCMSRGVVPTRTCDGALNGAAGSVQQRCISLGCQL